MSLFATATTVAAGPICLLFKWISGALCPWIKYAEHAWTIKPSSKSEVKNVWGFFYRHSPTHVYHTVHCYNFIFIIVTSYLCENPDTSKKSAFSISLVLLHSQSYDAKFSKPVLP